MGIQLFQQSIHLGQLPLQGEREGVDGTLHPLEQIHPDQMDHALFTVHLPETALSAAHLGIVLGLVGGQPARQEIAQRRISSQIQAADIVVDLPNRREAAGRVHVSLDVFGLEPLGEFAGFGSAVVLLHMFTRTGNGQHVQQLEVVEPQHLRQHVLAASGVGQVQPLVELGLGQADGGLDAGNALIDESPVVALGDEGDLVLEVGQPVVHRRGGEHQHPGPYPRLDDPLHEPFVAAFPLLVGGLVAEVVGLVDHHQVVVSPVDVGQIDIPGQATVTGQVGMVQNVVVEPVGREDVAPVVGLVEGPVIPQAFGTEDQNPVVAQLEVFDDRQGLEGLTEADAVGNDAATMALQLVDGSEHPIPLELEQLAPDHRVTDAGGGTDDPLLVQFLPEIPEQMVEHHQIDVERWAMVGDLTEPGQQRLPSRFRSRQASPQVCKPAVEELPFLVGLRALDQAEGRIGGQTKPFGGE